MKLKPCEMVVNSFKKGSHIKSLDEVSAPRAELINSFIEHGRFDTHDRFGHAYLLLSMSDINLRDGIYQVSSNSNNVLSDMSEHHDSNAIRDFIREMCWKSGKRVTFVDGWRRG